MNRRSRSRAGLGWHTFRHTVGTMLAEMGEDQLTIRDYLRHSNLHVTNKYLQRDTRAAIG
jgi:integrase